MSEGTAETMAATLEGSVEKHKAWLVATGDEIGKAGGKNENWKSQGRAMLEAARHETEPLVLLNLLRYQATRNKKTWTEPVDLASKLEAAIERCRKEASSNQELAMELIRHVLLYALRAYTYHEKKRKGGNGD